MRTYDNFDSAERACVAAGYTPYRIDFGGADANGTIGVVCSIETAGGDAFGHPWFEAGVREPAVAS